MIYTLSAHTDPNGSDIDGVARISRTFGYFLSEHEAREAARHNVGSMDECLYDWLVIERIAPGIFAMGEVIAWYHWDEWFGPAGSRMCWAACSAPPWATGIVNFSMG